MKTDKKQERYNGYLIVQGVDDVCITKNGFPLDGTFFKDFETAKQEIDLNGLCDHELVAFESGICESCGEKVMPDNWDKQAEGA